jgi:hypothetical protein
MGHAGGTIIIDQLQQIRDELREYFGSLNEVKFGARSRPLPRPDKLIVYEAVQKSGLPLLAGGFMDQPWIWMEIFEVIKSELNLQDNLEKANTKNAANSN